MIYILIIITPVLLLLLIHMSFLIYQVGCGIYKAFDLRNDACDDVGEKRSELSTVILIPVCNERSEILKRTLQKCVNVDKCTEVVVVENSTNQQMKEAAIDACREMGVTCHAIGNLGNKARALNHFLRRRGHEFDCIAVLDVDQQPEKHFITSLTRYFCNDKIAIVQAPQVFINEKENLLTYLYCSMQAVYFSAITVGKSALGFTTCSGTNFVAKFQALRDVGYFDETCKTEDTATSLALHKNGYQIKYADLLVARGLAPSTIYALFVQLSRYVIGNNQVLFLAIRAFFDGNNPLTFFYFANYAHFASTLILAGTGFYAVSILGYMYPESFIMSASVVTLFFILAGRKTSFLKGLSSLLMFGALSPICPWISLNIFNYNGQFSVTPKHEVTPNVSD